MGTYNVSKIEGWLRDFTSAKNKFTNTYYSDYKNSYIRSCNDSAVITMRNKLNQHYDRINRINNRIKDVWDDFLYDLKAIDNRLAGGKGSTNDSAVASKLSKLPTLKEYKATLKTRINSASAVVGTVDKLGWSEDRTALENIDYVLDRTEATITVAGTSVIEGLGKFGEGIMDACAPIVTEGYCLFNLMFNEDFTEETAKEARQNSRDFVAKEHVKSAFEDAYSESLRERAYGFDTVRAIGNEVGEVGGAAIISMIPGVGQVLGPAVYGVAKSGNYIEENFQDENNGYTQSLLKGYLKGAADGAFFWLGLKGDMAMKSAATAVVKEGGKATLKKGGILFTKSIYECGCSVVQDGTNILVDSIFLDGPVLASDGSVIQNPSFLDKLNYCFEQSGGVDGLKTSIATAVALSFGSDLIDINQISKNINTNTAIKNADINTSSTRKSLSSTSTKNIDVSSSSKRMQADVNANNMKNKIEGVNPKKIEASSRTSNPKVDTNTNSLRKEYDQLLNKSKESWFVNAKEAGDNGWAWDLNEVDQADKIARRMKELENTLGIKDTGVPESKIYDYSGAKKEADELARKISKEPIPGYENIDTNSQEYKKAMQEMYSKPSPSGKQDLSQFKKQKGNTFVGDKVGGSASDPDVLKKIDELRNAKASNINNSNEFRIIQDEVGGAAADPNVATISDNISKMDANGVNVKNKGNTFVGDKVGGSASDPEVLKKIDELRNTKTSKTNNSNEFKIIQDEVGGAAADPNVSTIADNISRMDANARNIPNNLTGSKKTDMWIEYNKFLDKVNTESADFANKLRLYSRGNFFEGVDEFAKNLDTIRKYEKQLGIPESKSVIPDIGKPFDWVDNKVAFEQKINTNRQSNYNYGGMASPSQNLDNQVNPHEININTKNASPLGNGDIVIDKTIKKGNKFWVSSKSISMKDLDDINKKSLFKKTTVYINDDMDPKVIFQNTKKPKNIIVIKDGIEYSSNGSGGIRLKPINNVSNSNVTSDVLNDSNFAKKLKEQTSPAEMSLKKKIISSVKPDYDETQLMRKIYIELNKKTNYDVDFVLGDKNTQKSILNKITTFDNLTNGNVVCKGWSELYAEALVDAGVDPSRVKVVKAQNAKHWWVEIDMGDNIIRADATDAFLGSTDLANCKFGDPTNGFLILNKKDAGLRINNEILSNNPNLLKNSNDYFREVDKSIDYINNNGYFTENVSKLKQTFENSDSPYNDLIKENDILKGNVSSYMNMDIPENMNGYDAFAYYRKFSSTLFGSKNSNALPSLKKININGKDYSATVVELFDGSNEFYLTFDEINGKKIYTREEYINGPMNNYKSFN